MEKAPNRAGFRSEAAESAAVRASRRLFAEIGKLYYNLYITPKCYDTFGARKLDGNLMKKILILFVIAIALFLSCTGKKGDIFGSVDWDEYGYGWELWHSGISSTGGFPPDPYGGVEYLFSEGSYYFTYFLQDPYDLVYPYSNTYAVSYTVKANDGFLFVNGADKHFQIYCGWYGPTKYTWDAAVASTGTTPPAKAVDGVTRVVSTDNLTVTYTVTRIELPDSGRVHQGKVIS